MNPRVFVNRPIQPAERVWIDGEDGHHLVRVLRVVAGEIVSVASAGHGYLGRVTDIDAREGRVAVDVTEALPSHEPECKVFLLQGLAKGDKMDTILQHGTEAGVTGFLAMATERSIVRLEPKKVADRLRRWQRIAHEAASQAQRDVVPQVDYAGSSDQAKEWLEKIRPDIVLFVDEEERNRGLYSALTAVKSPAPTVVCLIGPEGGWADSEREEWVRQGTAVSVTLGPRVFRTESAGLVTVAAVLHQFRDLGG